MIFPTAAELERRDFVVGNVVAAIQSGTTIKLPDFDRANASFEPPFALAALSEGSSPYTGTIGAYRYHFEGEEDLLHLFVIRLDTGEISVQEAQQVVSHLYVDVPRALLWLKPGKFSQHFYIGHDELLRYLCPKEPRQVEEN